MLTAKLQFTALVWHVLQTANWYIPFVLVTKYFLGFDDGITAKN